MVKTEDLNGRERVVAYPKNAIMQKVPKKANDVLVVTAAHELYLSHDVSSIALVKKNLLDGDNVPGPSVKSLEHRSVGTANISLSQTQ